MEELEKTVARHINYSLEKTTSLQRSLKDKELTEYQLFTSRVFIGLKSLSSLLVFWDTGFGKTLLGLYIIKNITFIYPSWKIFIFVKASLHEIWEEGVKYYCNKRVEILHYDDINVFLKFKNKIENYKGKKDRILIIIDEAHNLILRNKERNYDTKERKIGRLFRLIRKISNEEYNKLLLLTATPIVNDIKEFNLLVDIMRKGILTFDERYFRNENLVNKTTLKSGLLSLCSYRKVDSDSLKNTDENENFASKKIFIHKVIMSEYQESLFKEADKYELKNIDIYNLKPIRRMVSTFVFQGLKIRDGMTEEEFSISVKEKLETFKKQMLSVKINDSVKSLLTEDKEREIDDQNFNFLYTHSCKYITAIKLLLKSKGKCLIYEPFVTFEGIATLCKYLDTFGISYIEYSKFSTTRQSNLNEFNKEGNNNGEIIKCCIITNAGSEGISFTCVNDLIILDIPWSESQFKQIIGRSIRYNSHKNTDRKYVNVHVILAFTRTGSSSDNEQLQLVKKKLNRINQIYEVLKETSIEFIHNRHKDMEPIEVEYIYNFLQKTKVDFFDESMSTIVKQFIKIKFSLDGNIVEPGYFDDKTKYIYNENMVLVGKVREKKKDLYDIFLHGKDIVYNIDSI